VKKILTEAAAKDKEEDQRYGKDKRGDELPNELKDRGNRLIRLKECQKRLERESEEKAAKQQEKIDARQVEEAISGCKKRGRELYRKRSPMVEGVFGQIKGIRRCDRLMRRGIEASRSEWNLICATHNLLKLWRNGKVCWN